MARKKAAAKVAQVWRSTVRTPLGPAGVEVDAALVSETHRRNGVFVPVEKTVEVEIEVPEDEPVEPVEPATEPTEGD